MKLLCISIVTLLLVVSDSAIGAAMRPVQRAARRVFVAQSANGSGLVVAPFAVPVAVPVTVISQPLLLYSYRQYATPAAGQTEADQPVDGGAQGSPLLNLTPPSAPSPTTPAMDSAVALLTARCAKCHTGAAPPGHLQIFDAAGQIVAKLPRRAIVEMASPDEAGKQRMPPGELPKLSEEELAALRLWARPPRDLEY
jgi:mono/diheme cytochrome c family protein